MKSLDSIIDLYTEESIIESLMNFYKDFNYVNYILDSDFYIGYSLFVKMKERELKEIEDKIEDRHFQCFVESRTELTFKEYLDQVTRKIETKQMSDLERDKEEQRILNQYAPKSFDLSQFRKEQEDV